MTTTVVHPAELERVLQARVEAARAKRAEDRRSYRRSRSGRVRRSSVAIVAGALFALTAAAAWATHGSSFIDLTTDDTVVSHNGALFTQGGFGSGTGNFDPFLTLQPGGSVETEAGFNVCSEPVFGFSDAAITCPSPTIENQGGDRTHELRASSVPAIDVGGTLYREFFLDSNDQGGEPWMSIQVIRLYLDAQPDLTYNPTTDSFTGNSGPVPSLLWDLDGDGDQTILMNTQGLESGSGVSDISVLVPDSLFPVECFYGSTTCNQFIYFGTIAGDPALVAPGHPGKNWNTTAGFEEWSTELLPVVNVQKSVDIAFDRTYPWDVQKEADGEPDVINVFAGDTATIDWTVTATVGSPTDSDASITGDIVITNPTGGAIPAIIATVEDVEDVLTLGATPHDAAVSCPDDFPFDIGAGGSVTCTYSFAPESTDDGTNTATVTLGLYDKQELVETIEYSDTEDVVFADATVTEIDECVEVTDDNATPANTADDETLDAELCANESPGVYPDSNTVGPFTVETCGSTTVTNTAYTETNDTQTIDSDPDSVTVNCHELTVTKNANEALTRTYPWDIQKEADGEPDVINLFAGDTATIDWTVTATVGTAVDSGWLVSGTITLSNPAPIQADDVSVADQLTGGLNATVDCDSVTNGNQATVDIPAATIGGPGIAACAYSRALPDGTNRTNTATATLFGANYTGTAAVNFADATVTEIDECVEVTDDNATPANTADDETLDAELCANESPGVYPDSNTVGPFTVETCGSTTVTNTAYTETNDTQTIDSDPDSVTVNCYELTVTKNANTTYSRDYDWDVQKTRFVADGESDGDGDPLTLTLDEGQVYTANYEITVTMTGSMDDDHAVSGTITIANPAPMLADDVAVTDVVSHAVDADINAIVDCDAVTIGNQATVDVAAAVMGVAGTATCSYSADLDDDEGRLNTATATLFGIDYDGTANVTFDLDNPTTEIDECIDITDNAGTAGDTTDDIDLGTVCVDDLDANDQYTDEYTMDIGPFAVCGPATFVNTVTWATTDDTNDTDESGSDTYTVNVDVPCPQGCTLTQGYWKTHNDTFWGGAPSDETWFLLGDIDGDGGLSEGELETFFGNADLTYFDAMWTAPQGNAYFQLSRQYIAAVLNQLDGAAVPANVQAAIDAAEALFTQYTPAAVAAAKGKGGKDLRAQFTTLAGTLASYNEGLIGPGHCDEDQTSTAVVLPPLLPARRRGLG